MSSFDAFEDKNTEIIAKCNDRKLYLENCEYCRKHGLRHTKRGAREEHRTIQRFLSQSLIQLLTRSNIKQSNGRPYVQSTPKGFLQHPETWVARQGLHLRGWPKGLPQGGITNWPIAMIYAVSAMLLKETIFIEPVARKDSTDVQLQNILASPRKVSSRHLDETSGKDDNVVRSSDLREKSVSAAHIRPKKRSLDPFGTSSSQIPFPFSDGIGIDNAAPSELEESNTVLNKLHKVAAESSEESESVHAQSDSESDGRIIDENLSRSTESKDLSNPTLRHHNEAGLVKPSKPKASSLPSRTTQLGDDDSILKRKREVHAFETASTRIKKFYELSVPLDPPGNQEPSSYSVSRTSPFSASESRTERSLFPLPDGLDSSTSTKELLAQLHRYAHPSL